MCLNMSGLLLCMRVFFTFFWHAKINLGLKGLRRISHLSGSHVSLTHAIDYNFIEKLKLPLYSPLALAENDTILYQSRKNLLAINQA